MGNITAARLTGIWCEQCRRAGHEAKMCAAREPRRFNGLCDTCRWFGHLSCDCLLSAIAYIPTCQPFPLHRKATAAAPAMISRVIRRRGQPHAPSLALSGVRGTTAATVQRHHNISTAVATTATVPTRVRSSSTDAAPMVVRGTVRHFRSSSQAPAPSLALAGSRGTLAAMDRR